MSNTKTLLELPRRKPRTRQDMIAFLRGHFRYDTMNSWNRATSYAHCIKVGRLNMSSEDKDRCYDMLGVSSAFEESGYSDTLREFDRRHEYLWQIGTNGRGGGYLVLYQGGQKTSGYKSYCPKCGQQNYREVTATDNICGRCRAPARVNFTKPPMDTFTWPGRGVDMDDDFDSWGTESLEDRVTIVRDFDQTCERACQAFLAFARQHQPQTKTVMVPRDITIAVPR